MSRSCCWYWYVVLRLFKLWSQQYAHRVYENKWENSLELITTKLRMIDYEDMKHFACMKHRLELKLKLHSNSVECICREPWKYKMIGQFYEINFFGALWVPIVNCNCWWTTVFSSEPEVHNTIVGVNLCSQEETSEGWKEIGRTASDNKCKYCVCMYGSAHLFWILAWKVYHCREIWPVSGVHVRTGVLDRLPHCHMPQIGDWRLAD